MSKRFVVKIAVFAEFEADDATGAREVAEEIAAEIAAESTNGETTHLVTETFVESFEIY